MMMIFILNDDDCVNDDDFLFSVKLFSLGLSVNDDDFFCQCYFFHFYPALKRFFKVL